MKKAQEYAVGTVIYLITFVVILMVGTYGLHARFSIMSMSQEYQITVLNMEEMVDEVINIISSERRYALEKSLYLVASHGGYFPSLDFQRIPDCMGGDRVLNLTHCIKPDDSVYPSQSFKIRNPNLRHCGIALQGYVSTDLTSPVLLILPEREYGIPIFYYEGGCGTAMNILSDEPQLIENVERMSRFFSEIDPQVYDYLERTYGRFVDFDKYYTLKIHGFDEVGGQGVIDYTWYPMNSPKIELYDGPNPYNSTVFYSRDLAISGRIENDFYSLAGAVIDHSLEGGTGEGLKDSIEHVLDRYEFTFDFIHCSSCLKSTEDKYSFDNSIWAFGDSWDENIAVVPWDERKKHTSLSLGDKIVILGGSGFPIPSDLRRDVWVFDVSTNSWIQATENAGWTARKGHTSVVTTTIGGERRIWVLGGYDGIYKNDVWYSENEGRSWVQATEHAGWTARKGHTSVFSGGAIFVLGGYDGDYKNDIRYSTDGVTWHNPNPSGHWTARKGHTSVVTTTIGGERRIWVLGGTNSSGHLNDVWYSSDGISWTKATSSAGWTEREYHTSVVFDNKIWVIGGWSGDTYLNDVWHSSDGVGWTEATSSAGWTARRKHTSVVTTLNGEERMWVIGGEIDSGPLDLSPRCSVECEGIDISEITGGKYDSVEDLAELLYKTYLNCFPDEDLTVCAQRKITESLISDVADSPIIHQLNYFTTKMLFTSLNILDFNLDVGVNKTYYYNPLGAHNFQTQFERTDYLIGKEGGFISREDVCEDLTWDSFFDNPANAIQMAEREFVQSSDRKVYIRRKFDFDVSYSGIVKSPEAEVEGVRIVIFSIDKDGVVNELAEDIEMFEAGSLLDGYVGRYELMVEHVAQPARVTCYNPNWVCEEWERVDGVDVCISGWE